MSTVTGVLGRPGPKGAATPETPAFQALQAATDE